ncbi:putative membrane protein [Roseibium hamelinense]|uniref:Putative membrane protein n=1 Tax=Roseibium hamelinense TaxID=150831 RepID=A0A562TA50_9HYPH|nr:NnrU family protein [Roseibium hamelinense]MTI43487.1 NnrU family protein [Roseibium hamelinense]TWI89720.1 putative membrane protein [Roseibium hamelinense]
MLYFLVGLIVFFGLHTLPMFPERRAAIVAQMGDMPYRAVYSIASIASFVVMIYGYGMVRGQPPILYYPPEWTGHLVMLLMVPVFPLLIAAYVQGRLKRTFKHPMLVAIKLWAFSHLLVRGDLASVILFGSFLVWAVADRISVKRRHGGEPSVALHIDENRPYIDGFVIIAGLILYGLFVWKGHALVIGVPLT